MECIVYTKIKRTCGTPNSMHGSLFIFNEIQIPEVVYI